MDNLSNKAAGPLSSIGSTVERGLAYVGGLAQLLGQALGHAFRSPLKRSLNLQRACHQAMVVGVGAVPVISFITFFMGVLGGSLFGIIGADYTFGTYVVATRDALYMRDIISGLVKSIVFGLVITGVGCREGFATGAGSEEVGRSTTAAVVTSIFLVV